MNEARSEHNVRDAANSELTILERVALLVLLALIPLRAVLSETRTFEVPRLFRNLDTPPGAMPATTMAIFAVIVAAAVVVATVRLWRGGPRYRWTGAEIGILTLAAAMAVSTLRAGQKHLALTGSLDFLGLLIYLVTLRQLLVRPWHLRLVLVVLLATGAMVVAKCGYQKWVEIPDTIRYYEEHREELTQGSQSDERSAGMLHDYEQRMRSGAVTGYFQHPNVLASYLILVILTAAAVVQGRLKRRAGWTLIAPAMIGLGALVALYYAQSKGAAVACGLAILIWLGGTQFASVIRRRPMTVIAAFWVAFALGAVALVATLHAKPEALGRSMLFRSLYWQGATSMIRHQSLWGIGADNFGRYFTRYKPVECPEDVEDPHSWPVKAAAEWGMLGLLGLFAVFVGVSRRLGAQELEVPNSGIDGADPRDRVPIQAGGSIILWSGGIGAIVFVWWALILSGSPKDYAVLILYLPAMCWVVFTIFTSCESNNPRFLLDDPPGPIFAALCAGMIGFLIHTGIDLALFQGGAATTFFAMMAVALAARDSIDEPLQLPSKTKKAAAATVAAVGSVGLASFSMGVVRPMAVEGAALQQARLPAEATTWDDYQASAGYQSYLQAMDAWRFDATAIDELIEELTTRISTVAHVDFASGYVSMMHARDPQNASAHHYLATVYYQRYRLGNDPGDLQRSIMFMSDAVGAYPTSPNKRLMMASLYEQLAVATNSASVLQLTVKELQKALELDEQRIYVSAPNRLSAERRAAIQKRVNEIIASLPTLNPLGGQ